MPALQSGYASTPAIRSSTLEDVAHVLFTTLGSYGDLYPYLAVASDVKKLGHRVTIATSATYRDKVETEGIGFAPVRPDISLDNREMMQFLFDQRRGTERVLRQVAAYARESYQDTLEAARHADVVVTHPITMAAVLVAEKRQLPWISTVLAPSHSCQRTTHRFLRHSRGSQNSGCLDPVSCGQSGISPNESP